MTGPAGETPGTPTAGETPGSATEGATPDPKDDLAGLRDALAKERDARRRFEAEAKKNAAAAQKLAEAEDADKSEIQRAAEKAATAEARATHAEARLLRYEVAAAKGITHSMAGRLQGTTREELEADADELLAQLKPGDGHAGGGSTGQGAAPDTRTRPKENLRPGSAPDAEPEDNDPSKLAALIPRG